MKKVDIYDRSLKVLARHYPKIFLSLLIESVENFKIRVENPEINLPEKRIDYAWRVSDGKQEAYFVFEFQFRASRKALRSAYAKCALIHEAMGLPAIGVILYLREKGSHKDSYEVGFHGCTNTYRFETNTCGSAGKRSRAGRGKSLRPF
ncbi:MAG: hypothetical protein AB1611_09685 [bacterium]